MTASEAKILLNSRENRLATKAVLSIRNGESADVLRAYLDSGAPDICWFRDPNQPRTRLLVCHLLDVAYDDPTAARASTPIAGKNIVVGSFGEPNTDTTSRLAHFSLMLERGFTAGDNGWRGGLLSHVYAQAVHSPLDDRKMAFANALENSGRYPVSLWALSSYHWLGNPASYNAATTIGLDPRTPGLVEQCFRYLNSAGPETSERIKVISELISSGASFDAKTISNILADRLYYPSGLPPAFQGGVWPAELAPLLEAAAHRVAA